MTLENALLKFAKSNIDEKNDWYNWQIINEKKLPLGIILPNGNQYAKNVALKKALHNKWKETTNQEERRILIKYYISTWGGIHGNSEETISFYSCLKPEVLIKKGSVGIASWSKALCVYNPEMYAIFDARVSASLNALQIIHNTNIKELFPILTSRNKTITDFHGN